MSTRSGSSRGYETIHHIDLSPRLSPLSKLGSMTLPVPRSQLISQLTALEIEEEVFFLMHWAYFACDSFYLQHMLKQLEAAMAGVSPPAPEAPFESIAVHLTHRSALEESDVAPVLVEVQTSPLLPPPTREKNFVLRTEEASRALEDRLAFKRYGFKIFPHFPLLFCHFVCIPGIETWWSCPCRVLASARARSLFGWRRASCKTSCCPAARGRWRKSCKK